MKKLVLFFVAMNMFIQAFAQGAEVEMADTFRADGKIYVVVICVAIILLGIALYLFAIDRRLKMLEKNEALKN